MGKCEKVYEGKIKVQAHVVYGGAQSGEGRADCGAGWVEGWGGDEEGRVAGGVLGKEALL